jgi:hypothetical protein
LLHTALRTAVRASIDVATATTIARLQRDYNSALQSPTTERADLMKVMYRGLDFLEAKHNVELAYVGFDDQATIRHDVDAARLRGIATRAIDGSAGPVVHGESFGLSEQEFLVLSADLQVAPETNPRQRGMLKRAARWLLGPNSDNTTAKSVTAAIYARRPKSAFRPKERSDIVRDVDRFMDGWQVAMAMLTMRDEIVRKRVADIDAITDMT